MSSLGISTALQALALWGWHVPALFTLALEHPGWHVVQHVSFLGSALLFWHAVWRAPARGGMGGDIRFRQQRVNFVLPLLEAGAPVTTAKDQPAGPK